MKLTSVVVFSWPMVILANVVANVTESQFQFSTMMMMMTMGRVNLNLTDKTLPVLLTHEQEVLYSSNHVILNRDLENGAREVSETLNFDPGCGLTKNRLKIIGGSVTSPNESPWMAYLLMTKYNETYMCGGFLVSDRHLITVAHCTLGVAQDGIRAVLGDHDRRLSTDSRSFMIFSERIDIHPSFNEPERNDNDIAVITLTNRVPLGRRIAPVCLPTVANLGPMMRNNYTGLAATVSGWGRIGIGIGDPVSDELQQVQVSVIDDDRCRANYEKIFVPITDRMICAGSPQGGKDSCQGDSGGPLVVRGIGDRRVVIGVASFGFSCASATFPGVYTRVDRMLDFIIDRVVDTKTTTVSTDRITTTTSL